MDKKKHNPRTSRIRLWFTRKHKKSDLFHIDEVLDEVEDEENSWMDDNSSISTNEVRIFVGTWNVAGRSPVGSLAVDLDEWLNVKDAADIYVLGFQEIVPLKARNVIGVEDPTEATNWNLLIKKTLNDIYGCPCLTPLLNPVNCDNYQYMSSLEAERRSNFTGHEIPVIDYPRIQQVESNQYSRYKLIASKKMVGVFISVWMKRELLKKYFISGVKVCSVACGIMGYFGNKGSVSVSMTIEGTSFCFIAAHLASGEKKGDEERRNHQVSEIFRRTFFSRPHQDGDHTWPFTILGHDRIFWFGDLNYRLFLEDGLARQLIKKQDWRALHKFDQLEKELEDGGVFQGWKEGSIDFAPTYKYSSYTSNRYSGGIPVRAGEKQRTPAWCDRILWYGKGVKQLTYFRSESKFSDHKPVSALFSTQIEVMKVHNPKVASSTPFVATTSKSIGHDKHDRDATPTLISLIGEHTESSATQTHRRRVM